MALCSALGRSRLKTVSSLGLPPPFKRDARMLGRVWLGLLGWSGLGTEGLGGEWGAGTARCGEEVAGGISNHRYSNMKGN